MHLEDQSVTGKLHPCPRLAWPMQRGPGYHTALLQKNLDNVYQLLEDFGFEVTLLVRFGVSALADMDLDGDGVNDAISGAFDYDAVPCGIVVN